MYLFTFTFPAMGNFSIGATRFRAFEAAEQRWVLGSLPHKNTTITHTQDAGSRTRAGHSFPNEVTFTHTDPSLGAAPSMDPELLNTGGYVLL
jgi:hypothetical protein